MSSITLGSAGPINVLDFGPFLDGTRKWEVAEGMISSFKEIGFVYLVNHGIPKNKIDSMFDLVIQITGSVRLYVLC